MTAMSINPYESPRGLPERKHRPKVIPVVGHVPAYLSVIVVVVAGILGGGLFFGVSVILHPVESAFQAALITGIGASFCVLIAADGGLYGKRPPLVSAVIGMLLASPFALAISWGLGLQAYDMSVQKIPGAALVGLLTYASFFLNVSLGGWLAIRRTRSVEVSEKQI
jgi:hypothetical protein